MDMIYSLVAVTFFILSAEAASYKENEKVGNLNRS